jgi:hypothetical protein
VGWVGGEAGWLKVVVGNCSSIILFLSLSFPLAVRCRSICSADLSCITALSKVLCAADEEMRSNQSPQEQYERRDASGGSRSTTRLPRP